jgi:hypothetical protein
MRLLNRRRIFILTNTPIMSQSTLSAQWAEKLKPLVGRTIVGVRHLDTGEASLLGIAHQPVCLQLDDGALLWPMADDEGNDAGVLFFQAGTKTSGLPAGAPRL